MMPGRSYTPATIRWIIRNRKWLLIGPMLFFGALVAGRDVCDEGRVSRPDADPRRAPAGARKIRRAGRGRDHRAAAPVDQPADHERVPARAHHHGARPLSQQARQARRDGGNRRGHALRHQRRDHERRPVQGDLHRQQPVQGDAGHAAARVVLRRREPQGSRTAGGRHQPVPRIAARQHPPRARRAGAQSAGVQADARR